MVHLAQIFKIWPWCTFKWQSCRWYLHMCCLESQSLERKFIRDLIYNNFHDFKGISPLRILLASHFGLIFNIVCSGTETIVSVWDWDVKITCHSESIERNFILSYKQACRCWHGIVGKNIVLASKNDVSRYIPSLPHKIS